MGHPTLLPPADTKPFTQSSLVELPETNTEPTLQKSQKKHYSSQPIMKLLVFAIAFLPLVFSYEEEIKRLALENPNLYDGDIIGIAGPYDSERNAMPGKKYRWPDAKVPYVIDISLAKYHKAIDEAIADYHNHTCVRFIPRTNEKDYVKIFYGNGCNSHVGKARGEQVMSLGKGCHEVGTIVHELGHVLGFYHEHSRSDRDDYIVIHLENVQKGMESNFEKLSPSQNILLSPFDYGSIMIYGNKAFSKDGKSHTLDAKNGQTLYYPYDKKGMTESDIRRVRMMYHC
ncbi:astacin-like metalloprotease toxin 1 [Trichonephila clavipes]|nr:astacin-like metalloprotease toxin 1 [Trichonephila clavipes]